MTKANLNDFPTRKPDHDKDGYKAWHEGNTTYYQHPNGNRFKQVITRGEAVTTDYQTGETGSPELVRR